MGWPLIRLQAPLFLSLGDPPGRRSLIFPSQISPLVVLPLTGQTWTCINSFHGPLRGPEDLDMCFTVAEQQVSVAAEEWRGASV